jgi:hypothetical protein
MKLMKNLSGVAIVLLMAIAFLFTTPVLAAQAAAPIAQQGTQHIYSITETRAPANSVTLTVITGLTTENVWVQHSGERYVQGTRTLRTNMQQSWEITYTPAQFIPHGVQVSANRSYVTFGAAQHDFYVTLHTSTPPEVVGERFAALCQVPAFVNHRIGTYPTNGLIAGLVREYILELAENHRYDSAGEVTITPQMEQRHDRLLQDILNVWDDDPATRVFGINRAGMAARFEDIGMTIRSIEVTNNLIDGRTAPGLNFVTENYYFFSLGYFDLLSVDNFVEFNINNAISSFLTSLFSTIEGYGHELSLIKAEHFIIKDFVWEGSWSVKLELYHFIGNNVGLHNLFIAARQGQDYFSTWMTEQIRLINPHLNFTYDMLQYAGAGTMLHVNSDYNSQQDAWRLFVSVLNNTQSLEERNRSARETTDFVMRYYEMAKNNNLQQNVSVFDHLRPMYDFNTQSIVIPIINNFWWGFDSSIPLWNSHEHRTPNPVSHITNYAVMNFLTGFHDRHWRNMRNPLPHDWVIPDFTADDERLSREFITGFLQAAERDTYFNGMPFNHAYLEQILTRHEIYFVRFEINRSFSGFYDVCERKIVVSMFDNREGRDSFATTSVHEIAHVLGLGESLAHLWDRELVSRQSWDAPYFVNFWAWNRNSNFDRLLLNRVGDEEFWRAAFSSQQAYAELWDANMSDIATFEDMQMARTVASAMAHDLELLHYDDESLHHPGIVAEFIRNNTPNLAATNRVEGFRDNRNVQHRINQNIPTIPQIPDQNMENALRHLPLLILVAHMDGYRLPESDLILTEARAFIIQLAEFGRKRDMLPIEAVFDWTLYG